MKKTFLFVLFTCIASLGWTQVVNGSLEDWSTTVAFSDPADLISSNNQNYLLDKSSGTITRVAGLNGSAARIEAFPFGSFSFAGTLGTDNVLLSGKDGIDFSAQPDSVYFLVNYDISDGDFAIFSFEWRTGSSIVNSLIHTVSGSSGGWEVIALDIPDYTQSTDNLFFQIASSGAIPASLDSWMEVDEIRFSGTEQIPNNELEEWEDYGYDQPTDWISADDLMEPLTGLNSIEMSAESTDGSFSASITGQERSVTDDVGVLFTYLSNASFIDFDDNIVEGGWGVPEHSALLFNYQYESDDNLNGIFTVQAQDASGDLVMDTVIVLPETSAWTEMEVILPVDADNVVFALGVAGDENGDIVSDSQTGEILWVDQFELSSIVATKNIAKQFGWNAWHNEGSNTVNINLDQVYSEVTVTVLDQNGRVILQELHSDSQNIIQPLVNANTGIYIVRIETETGVGSQQFLIK